MQVLITGSAGFIGYQFAAPAELMRDYEGWKTACPARHSHLWHRLDKQLLRRIPEKSPFKSMRNRSFPSRTGIPLYPLPQLYVQANGPL